MDRVVILKVETIKVLRFSYVSVLVAVFLAGCSGGGAPSDPNPSVVAAPVPRSASTAPAATPSPVSTPFASADTLTDSSDWPTFAHDLSRTSTQKAASALSAANVGTLQLLWTVQAGAAYDLASPIVYKGIVYAADISGNLVAVSAATGQVLWTRAFGVEIKMTPAAYDGHLFIGTFLNRPNATSNFFSLDPLTGATQWSVTITGGVHGSPVAMNGEVFVPVSLGDPDFCNPGGVYEFDEATGASGAAWLVGGSTTSNGGAVWSPLTYDGSRILFGTGNTCLTATASANAVVAISPATLTAQWQHQTADPFSDDDVGGGILESGGRAFVTGKNGFIYALDPSSGATDWSKNLGAPDLDGSYSTPVLAAGTLITSIGYAYDPYAQEPTGTEYGKLVGLNPASGNQLWQVLAVSPFYEPPAIVNGLAFTTIDSTAVALDAAGGSQLWSSPIAADSRSALAIVGDQVFVADAGGNLYAYGLPTSANASLRARARATFRFTQRPPHFVNRIPAFCRLK